MCKCTIIFNNREMKLIFDPECLLSSTPLGKNDGRRMFFFRIFANLIIYVYIKIMLKRGFIFLTFIMLVFGSVSSQELMGNKRIAVLNDLVRNSAAMKSQKCSFVQTKKSKMMMKPAVSEGEMEYRSPNHLRWEYSKPNKVSVVVDGDSVALYKDGKAMDANSSKMVAGLAKTILGCVKGSFDEKAFSISVFEKGDQYIVSMTPTRRNMKRMFSKMTLTFDKNTSEVVSVVLAEKDGSTQIDFTPVK